MHIDLSVPDEPTELQEIVAANVAHSEGEFDPNIDHRLPITKPSPGRVILGREIRTYLWRAWEANLRQAGFDYRTFGTTLTHAGAALSRWATGEGSWEAVTETMEATIEEMGEELTQPLSV